MRTCSLMAEAQPILSKDFASERNESLLSNCRMPLNLLQRYEEYFIPPNKITNIFQLFSSCRKWHIAKLCEPLRNEQNILYIHLVLQYDQEEKWEILNVRMWECDYVITWKRPNHIITLSHYHNKKINVPHKAGHFRSQRIVYIK